MVISIISNGTLGRNNRSNRKFAWISPNLLNIKGQSIPLRSFAPYVRIVKTFYQRVYSGVSEVS
jgi:hypothetical protein